MKKFLFIGASLVTIGLFQAGCGGGNNNPSTAGQNQCQAGYVFYNGSCQYSPNGQYGQYGQYGNQCPAGQTYTQYGCVAQGQCQVGYGFYNNQCIPGTSPAGTYQGGQYNNGGYMGGGYQNGGYMGGYQNGGYMGGYYGGYYGAGNSACQMGWIYTVYGCAPQGPCMPNYGYVGGMCYSRIQ